MLCSQKNDLWDQGECILQLEPCEILYTTLFLKQCFELQIMCEKI
jgi:hypothetical protein